MDGAIGKNASVIKEKDYIEKSALSAEELDKEIQRLKEQSPSEWPVA